MVDWENTLILTNFYFMVTKRSAFPPSQVLEPA